MLTLLNTILLVIVLAVMVARPQRIEVKLNDVKK